MSIYDEMLPSWDHPTCFDSDANLTGTKPTGYVICSVNRDGSILDNSNFASILSDLGGESEHVQVIRHNHWGCGWLEYIIVDKSAPIPLLDKCVDILRSLAEYPIYDETDYNDRLFLAVSEYWDRANLRKRIRLCAEANVSIFGARYDREIPANVYDRLIEQIN